MPERTNVIDGWKNFLSGLGVRGHDPKVSTTYEFGGVLTDQELSDLYRTDGIARKIIDRPVWDSLREGFEVHTGDGEIDQMTTAYVEDTEAITAVSKALKWDRLYGGAMVIVGADDGRPLSEPLNRSGIKTIEFWRTISAPSYYGSVDLDGEPQSKRYGQPVMYNISPKDGTTYSVHWTRVYQTGGLEIPPYSSQSMMNRGDSILQGCFEAIRGLGTTYSNVESILNDFIVGVMKVKNLQGMIASKKESDILARMHIIDMVRSVINTILIDENEEYQRISANVSGLSDLLERAVERVSMVSNIPVRILLGKQSGGLNNEGGAETTDYYDFVGSYQTSHVQPLIEWALDLIFYAKDGPTAGKIPEDWGMKFNPIWQMSEKEMADLHKTQAEADASYIMNGVVTPQEIADSRFGTGEYSLETHLFEPRKPDGLEEMEIEEPENE